MKSRLPLISLVLLFFFVSCDKEEKRIVDFLVEFATVLNTSPSFNVQLDNGEILNSKNSTDLNVEIGDRVIINYTPLDKEEIIINSIRRIFLGNIEEVGYPNKLKTSPVKVISVWVNGNYLNMSIQTEYHSKSHIAALYRDMEADKPTLYFSYSREDDPPGAPTLSYLSFHLDDLQKENFAIYINTYDGKRKFYF